MSNNRLKPLMIACKNNDYDQVKLLLEQKYPVDEQDSDERTSLFYCANSINTKCATELVKSKADVNHQDKDGFTPLHVAVIAGNLKLCDFLIKNGSDINLTDSEMHSVIHWAVVCGHDHLINFLLKHNAEAEIADIHGAYPIHYAAQMCGQVDIWDSKINRNPNTSLRILKKLIEHNVKIDAEDFDQRNAIIWAASSGSSEALIELFKAGSDPNKHEKDGLTALHCASSRGYIDCIKVLIEICKLSVDIMDNNNCTPIFYAATMGKVETCEILINYGSNLHLQDCKGRTVFHCAAAKGRYDCLKVLCNYEKNIWLRNRRGDYPIQEAYFNKQLDCVYLFLDKIKNSAKSANMYDNCTLLHNAASDNNLKLCKRLVNESIDINCLMRTYSNGYLTPLDIAELKSSTECFEFLKNNGGIRSAEIEKEVQETRNEIQENKIEIQEDLVMKNKRKYLSKLLSIDRTNKEEEDDDVFHNNKTEKNDQKAEKLVDKIDVSNQTDLSENLSKDNTSENLILAIKKKDKLPVKKLPIYRDRSAQTFLVYKNQENFVKEENSNNDINRSSNSSDEEFQNENRKKVENESNDEKAINLNMSKNRNINDIERENQASNQNKKKTSLESENLEESLVRLVFQEDLSKNLTFSKKYNSIFERKRFLWKSLYEIRRNRLNNKDIVINSDLYNLLIRNYDYDIKKNCNSLKDLEKTLELLAFELSEEYKRQVKRAQTMLSIKKSYSKNNKQEIEGEKHSIKRSKENLKLNNEQNLQSAYKPLLPNDIYKQHYNTKTKPASNKDNITPREKTLILPLITQKHNNSY